MSWRRDLDLLDDEEVDMAIKPHTLSFISYHVFFIYLILVAFFLKKFHLILKDNISIFSVLRFLDAALGRLDMNIVDAIFLVSFWIVVIISSWVGSRLLHNKMLMLYAILLAASGTALEVYWSITHFETALIQRSYVKIVLLAGTSIASMILIEIYRRRCLYVVTNRRVIIRKGFRLKEDEMRYDEIARILVKQGILGRAFNFGTVILVSMFDFRLNRHLYGEVPEALRRSGVNVVDRTLEEESLKSRRQMLLFGVPDPRRVRIIIGNRQLEAKES